MSVLSGVVTHLKNLFGKLNRKRRWKERTLVVGPCEPVDGDSLACVLAVIRHLRKQGKEAYTLPTTAMFPQLAWMVSAEDIHPACLSSCGPQFTTDKLQEMFDRVCTEWQPDEIVLLDGQMGKLGFDQGNVPVYTIDHHVHAGKRDDQDAYIQPAPSAGCLLIEQFDIFEPILVVSILTDTFWLRENMPADAIDSLYALRKKGGLTNELLAEYQRKLMVKKNPAVLKAIRSCYMEMQGDAVFAVLDEKEKDIQRGVMGDLGYYFADLCVIRGDGYVSMRTSKSHAELGALAAQFGGGGHKTKAAATLPDRDCTARELWQKFLANIRTTT